ncbi:hypothetical protein BJ508DRAFT_179431 [Ascobolus immersus RN42]|uniref:Uncharacterized protein n=1 Tax=Ascobolus immersus RN42 TaxID=1160509 RepID=A0A3N4HSZ4_ASCIM|nr:hypothetical protein BJ508DRAFT_179431 [Ascobolus immersus RN42]
MAESTEQHTEQQTEEVKQEQQPQQQQQVEESKNDSLAAPSSLSRAPTPARTSVKWKGKTMIIALPTDTRESYGEGESKTPLPLSLEEVKERMRKWTEWEQQEWLKVDGETRAVFPDEQDVRREKEDAGPRISIPDPRDWAAYVQELTEAKLRALGVALGDEPAAPSPSIRGPTPMSVTTFPPPISQTYSPPPPTGSALGLGPNIPLPLSPFGTPSPGFSQFPHRPAQQTPGFPGLSPEWDPYTNAFVSPPLPQPTPPAFGGHSPYQPAFNLPYRNTSPSLPLPGQQFQQPTSVPYGGYNHNNNTFHPQDTYDERPFTPPQQQQQEAHIRIVQPTPKHTRNQPSLQLRNEMAGLVPEEQDEYAASPKGLEFPEAPEEPRIEEDVHLGEELMSNPEDDRSVDHQKEAEERKAEALQLGSTSTLKFDPSKVQPFIPRSQQAQHTDFTATLQDQDPANASAMAMLMSGDGLGGGLSRGPVNTLDVHTHYDEGLSDAHTNLSDIVTNPSEPASPTRSLHSNNWMSPQTQANNTFTAFSPPVEAASMFGAPLPPYAQRSGSVSSLQGNTFNAASTQPFQPRGGFFNVGAPAFTPTAAPFVPGMAEIVKPPPVKKVIPIVKPKTPEGKRSKRTDSTADQDITFAERREEEEEGETTLPVLPTEQEGHGEKRGAEEDEEEEEREQFQLPSTITIGRGKRSGRSAEKNSLGNALEFNGLPKREIPLREPVLSDSDNDHGEEKENEAPQGRKIAVPNFNPEAKPFSFASTPQKGDEFDFEFTRPGSTPAKRVQQPVFNGFHASPAQQTPLRLPGQVAGLSPVILSPPTKFTFDRASGSEDEEEEGSDGTVNHREIEDYTEDFEPGFPSAQELDAVMAVLNKSDRSASVSPAPPQQQGRVTASATGSPGRRRGHTPSGSIGAMINSASTPRSRTEVLERPATPTPAVPPKSTPPSPLHRSTTNSPDGSVRHVPAAALAYLDDSLEDFETPSKPSTLQRNNGLYPGATPALPLPSSAPGFGGALKGEVGGDDGSDWGDIVLPSHLEGRSGVLVARKGGLFEGSGSGFDSEFDEERLTAEEEGTEIIGVEDAVREVVMECLGPLEDMVGKLLVRGGMREKVPRRDQSDADDESDGSDNVDAGDMTGFGPIGGGLNVKKLRGNKTEKESVRPGSAKVDKREEMRRVVRETIERELSKLPEILAKTSPRPERSSESKDSEQEDRRVENESMGQLIPELLKARDETLIQSLVASLKTELPQLVAPGVAVKQKKKSSNAGSDSEEEEEQLGSGNIGVDLARLEHSLSTHIYSLISSVANTDTTLTSLSPQITDLATSVASTRSAIETNVVSLKAEVEGLNSAVINEVVSLSQTVTNAVSSLKESWGRRCLRALSTSRRRSARSASAYKRCWGW